MGVEPWDLANVIVDAPAKPGDVSSDLPTTGDAAPLSAGAVGAGGIAALAFGLFGRRRKKE